jgi:hypothetical protein
MDREALNDYPLGKYDVTGIITTLVPDREAVSADRLERPIWRHLRSSSNHK